MQRRTAGAALVRTPSKASRNAPRKRVETRVMSRRCIAVCFYPLALSQIEAECALGAVGGAAASDVELTEKKAMLEA